MTTMLDFYRQHQISPVKQAIGDLPAHFQRRAGLYRALGLPPVAINGHSVLEVGPGSGENALYTLSLGPNVSYQLIEPNHAAAERLRSMLPAHLVEIDESRLQDITPFPYWDVVICEGLLGLSGGDPQALLGKLTGFVKPAGILVITTIDPISDCAEVIRRALAHRLLNRSASLVEQVETLKPAFTSHLNTLKGMTRSVEDWIVDNLLNPASIGPTFSIPEACQALDGQFEVLGSSPRFLTDWRWYKDTVPGTLWAQQAYWEQAHNLMDYRVITQARPDWDNRHLMRVCVRVREVIREFEQQPADASTEPVMQALMDLTGLPRLTMCAIRQAIQLLNTPPSAEAISEAKELAPWFGRGQQYLSFVRVN